MKQKMVSRFLLTCFVTLWQAVTVSAQSTVAKGIVQDAHTLQPIPGANVVIKNKADNHIVAYATTNHDGAFALPVHAVDLQACNLLVTCLGYEQQILALPTEPNVTVRLKEKPFALKEIAVKADKIVQRQDTTSYFVSSFASAKDRTIGDVLTRMPGIQVADDGRISYNGTPINRFYIEGIDLLGGKYNLATNNLAHGQIASVDVIENHQPVKALRRTGMDTETAINLRLKEGAKSRWSGHILGKGGIGTDEGLWEAEAFAARFSAKTQCLSTLKSNNSGKNLSDEGKTLTIDDLLYMLPGGEVSGHLKSEPSAPGHLDADRTRFNRSWMVSNSSMWKLTESAQIKSQLIYADDRNDYSQGVTSSYYLADSVLTKGTAEENAVRNRTLQFSATATVDRSTCYFSNELRYAADWKTSASAISGDDDSLSLADTESHRVENRFKFVRNTGKNIFQILSLNRWTFIPERLDVSGAATRRRQRIDKSNFFSNTNFRFARSLRKWTLAAHADVFGHIYQLESLYDDTQTRYQNDLNVRCMGGKLSPEITYQDEAWRVNLRLPVSLHAFRGERKAERVYARPEFYLRWKFIPRWTLFAAIGSTYPGNSLYYTAPILTDYKSMYAGFIGFDGRTGQRVGARVSYADPAEMLFAYLSATYSDENTRRSVSKQVDDGRVCYTYVPGDDRYKLWMADGSVRKGVDGINGSVELRGTFQNHRMPIEQNGTQALVDFGNYTLDLLVKSDASEWLEVDCKASYKCDFLKSDLFRSSTRHLTQRCLLTFYPTEDLHIKLNGEHYLSFFGSGQKKSTLFADIELVYRYKQVDFLATARNIFNQREYAYTLFSDLSSTHTRHRIRGINVLAGVNWYF